MMGEEILFIAKKGNDSIARFNKELIPHLPTSWRVLYISESALQRYTQDLLEFYRCLFWARTVIFSDYATYLCLIPHFPWVKQKIICIHHLSEPWHTRRLTELTLRRGTRLLAMSKATKATLINHWQRDSSRISVCYQGVDPRYQQWCAFTPHYVNLRAFILLVGAEYPRKNLKRVLHAFKELLSYYPELFLIKVGPALDEQERRHNDALITALGLEHRVIFIRRHVSYEELQQWYHQALFLLLASTMEGFGRPVVEAMQSGCAVLCSDIPALREITGNKTPLVDPFDCSSLVEGMRRLVANREHRMQLRLFGILFAARYQWTHFVSELTPLLMNPETSDSQRLGHQQREYGSQEEKTRERT